LTSQPDAAGAAIEDPTEDAFAEYAAGLSERLGALYGIAEFDTVRIYVHRGSWVETIRRARDEEGLTFFSWLAGVDWTKEPAVGEPVQDPDELEERYEVICRLSSIENADAAHFITELPKDDPALYSIVPLFGGAAWHERETHEMFGIDFRGHPQLTKLYLPDDFVGHPLRKSYPLLSREIKPWPGNVNVEPLPATDAPTTVNLEADGAGT
jgi:NADH-quinone oxidoreductase subunit C